MREGAADGIPYSPVITVSELQRWAGISPCLLFCWNELTDRKSWISEPSFPLDIPHCKRRIKPAKGSNKKQVLKWLGTAKANHRQPALSSSSAFGNGSWGGRWMEAEGSGGQGEVQPWWWGRTHRALLKIHCYCPLLGHKWGEKKQQKLPEQIFGILAMVLLSPSLWMVSLLRLLQWELCIDGTGHGWRNAVLNHCLFHAAGTCRSAARSPPCPPHPLAPLHV